MHVLGPPVDHVSLPTTFVATGLYLETGVSSPCTPCLARHSPRDQAALCLPGAEGWILGLYMLGEHSGLRPNPKSGEVLAMNGTLPGGA